MRRRPSIEAADLSQFGSPAATTEDRAMQAPVLPGDSLGRCARIAHTAPARADPAQNALTLHADLAIPSPATMRAAQRPEEESGNHSEPLRWPASSVHSGRRVCVQGGETEFPPSAHARRRHCTVDPLQGPTSAAQAQPINQGAVALHVDLRDVLQQPPPASHQQQQTAA